MCRNKVKSSLKKSPNKAFKSDSQRLAFSLRSSIAKRRSHLNAALAYFDRSLDDYDSRTNC
ncbi:hypothetical protein BTO19_25530 [Vibrio parahaemolyticus]|nr:hypothetical protein BTO19_25530 [Vibrio parahaemolyticus]TBT60232.1 hypothetical protein D5E77_26055 [Vibrio parahaemolyticus]